MNASTLRDIRLRALLGQALPVEDLVPVLEDVEDALNEANVDETDDLVGAVENVRELREERTRLEVQIEALEADIDELKARLAQLSPTAAGETTPKLAPVIALDSRRPLARPSAPYRGKPAPVIRVSFGSGHRAYSQRAARQTAYALYQRASDLDEDPERLVEAEHMYLEAIALDPRLACALTNLGNVRYRRGFLSEATDLYLQALALDDNQPEAHYNLGYVSIEQGKLDAAVKCLRKAVALDAAFADAHFNLAVALDQLGRRRTARQHWKRYLDLEPVGEHGDFARDQLGRVRVVRGRSRKTKQTAT